MSAKIYYLAEYRDDEDEHIDPPIALAAVALSLAAVVGVVCIIGAMFWRWWLP